MINEFGNFFCFQKTLPLLQNSFVAHSKLKLASVLHFLFHDNQSHYRSMYLKPRESQRQGHVLKKIKEK